MKYFILMLSIFIITGCKSQNDEFIENEISFSNNSDGAIFSGTFTKPVGADKCPAIILISGAGQQDRDESVYGHKPFKVLAEFLSKNGYGVLRYDDRGVGGSVGDVWNATLEIQASDAYAGIEYLKARKDVENEAIGIIGHSFGAMQGTILASKYQDISFLIMLGGIGLPFIENHMKSDSLNNTLKGEPREIVESGQKLLRELLFEMKRTPSNQDYQVIKLKLENIIRDWQSSLSGKAKEEIEKFIKSNPDFFIKNIAEEFATPVYISCAKYEPAAYLTKIKCPVLSIIGDKDIQAVPENNGAIEELLRIGGNDNYSVVAPKNINHLLQSCETGLINEYETIEEDFNMEIMILIKDWLNEIKTDNTLYK